jgi:hypothetical protein
VRATRLSLKIGQLGQDVTSAGRAAIGTASYECLDDMAGELHDLLSLVGEIGDLVSISADMRLASSRQLCEISTDLHAALLGKLAASFKAPRPHYLDHGRHDGTRTCALFIVTDGTLPPCAAFSVVTDATATVNREHVLHHDAPSPASACVLRRAALPPPVRLAAARSDHARHFLGARAGAAAAHFETSAPVR